MVMWAGISIAKETLEPLIGEAADPELYKKISEMVEAYDGILGTHDLIVHNYGPNKSMASIHAEVPRDADIEESHEIIDRIEREAARELGIFLVIHMDPIEVRDEEVLKSKQELEEVLQSIDERLNMHDFRMVKGKRQINLIFDLVVPFDYDKKGQEELLDKVIRMMQEKDRRYQFVITVDQGFVGT